MILLLHKQFPGIWNSIFPGEATLKTTIETINHPFVVFFLRQTNRLHIIIQNKAKLQIRSMSFSILNINLKDPLKPTSNLRIRLSNGSTYFIQDICVAALVDSKDGTCYIEV